LFQDLFKIVHPEGSHKSTPDNLLCVVFLLQNPPLEGDDFLTNLLEAKPVYATDPFTGAAYHINPAAIANAGTGAR
jgi:hypothetical protein